MNTILKLTNNKENNKIKRMRVDLENELTNTKLHRLCYKNTYTIDNKQVLEVMPNFAIIEGEINFNFCKPFDDSPNLKRVKTYNEYIDLVNSQSKIINGATGMFLACEKKENSSCLENLVCSSYSIFKHGNRLVGVTSIHTLLSIKDFSHLRCFINPYDLSPKFSQMKYEFALKKANFLEVAIPQTYLKTRENIINDYSKEESVYFHDRNNSKHPEPTLDILLFLLPAEVEDKLKEEGKFYELEDNDDWAEKSKFIYFSGFQSEEVTIKYDDEYKYSLEKNTRIPSDDAAFLDVKSVSFGEMVDHNPQGLGTAIFTSFTGSSGSGVINSNGKLAYITGQSYYDVQPKSITYVLIT